MSKKSAREERRERTRQRAATRQSEGHGGSSYLNLPEGIEYWGPDKKHENKITPLDFLMYTVSGDEHPDGIPIGDLWCVRPILVHYDVGPERKNVLCPKSWGTWPKGQTGSGARCPVCEAYAVLAADPDNWEDDDKKKVMKSLKPKLREIYNVLCLDEDEPTVKLFEISAHLFGFALNQAISEANDDAVTDFAEFEDGMTVFAKWRGGDLKKRNGDPILQVNPDGFTFEKREQDYPEEEWVGETIDLDAILIRHSYKEIDAMFQGVEPEEAEEKEEAEEEEEKEEDALPEWVTEETEEDAWPKPMTEDEVPDGHTLCIACEGERFNTRGKECRVCEGKGCVKEEKEEHKGRRQSRHTLRGRK